ncbi:MAG: carboxypeptidase-like regulatory domain-containing protein [Hyphomonas sp.]
MSNLAVTSSAILIASLCLTACITKREHVLAPSAEGIVIDAASDRPVAGAQVRYGGLERAAPAVTGADGRFSLEGRTEDRTIVAMPVGGVYRDSTLVHVSAPDLADGYASAAFISMGKPAQALYRVTVLLFPPDADETPLHAMMRDCIEGPEQRHALHLADHIAGLDPASPPAWLDEDAAEALEEHLSITLPASAFRDCERMDEAYAAFRAQTAALRAFGGP